MLINFKYTICLTKLVKLIIYFDGSCNSNTVGSMGIGVVIKRQGEIIKKLSEFAGEGTNNTAEYFSVIRALEEALALGADELEVRGDSELVIKQLRGEYKVKKKHLRNLHRKVMQLVPKFKRVIFTWVPREKNKEANYLAQRAIFKR